MVVPYVMIHFDKPVAETLGARERMTRELLVGTLWRMAAAFFEAQGRIRKAVSVIKNRGGQHEDSIRELRVDQHGVRVGETLMRFRGVLTGTPEYNGDQAPLMENRSHDFAR